MDRPVTVTLPERVWDLVWHELDCRKAESWTIEAMAEIERAVFEARRPKPEPATKRSGQPAFALKLPTPTTVAPEVVMEMVYIEEPRWVCPNDGSHWSRKDRDHHLGFCPNCETLLLPEGKTP